MMTKRRLIKAAGASAAMAGLGLAGCGPGGGTAHLRFKVIARARVGGEDYEGFAVNEMKARYTPGGLVPMMMGARSGWRRRLSISAARRTRCTCC